MDEQELKEVEATEPTVTEVPPVVVEEEKVTE